MRSAKTLKKVIHFIITVSHVCNIHDINNAVYKCMTLFVILYWSINTKFWDTLLKSLLFSPM